MIHQPTTSDVHYVDGGLPQNSYWAIEVPKPDGDYDFHEVCEAKDAQDKREVLHIYLDSIYEGNYKSHERDKYLEQNFGNWRKENNEW